MEPFGYAVLIAVAALVAIFNYFTRKAEREHRRSLSAAELKKLDAEFEESQRMF